ncbi:hypothetical protein BY458DRAFT_529644 [Sporodiniella umbellata]|nr:hypothetical protein BY458DRAFT_529644 [Sporodiniella umbellata]
MALFVARIPREMNNRDLEEAFSKYGKITRFEIKREGFGFVEFDDKRDAEDAMKGIQTTVAELVVEWAKNGGKRPSENECYHCGRSGHYARDCKDNRRDFRSSRGGGYDRSRRGGYDQRRRDERRDRSPFRDEYRQERRYDSRREYREGGDRESGREREGGRESRDYRREPRDFNGREFPGREEVVRRMESPDRR